MRLAQCARLVAVAATMALGALSLSASAQEISETHIEAAHSAIDAIEATAQFDSILPNAAQQIRAELIQQNPNMEEFINKTVEEKALELAGRRSDLEREAALAYARVFTEEELNQIAEFYNSGAGQKLLSDGSIVTREVLKAAQIWQRGVTRDLSNSVNEQLQAAKSEQASDASAGQ